MKRKNGTVTDFLGKLREVAPSLTKELRVGLIHEFLKCGAAFWAAGWDSGYHEANLDVQAGHFDSNDDGSQEEEEEDDDDDDDDGEE